MSQSRKIEISRFSHQKIELSWTKNMFFQQTFCESPKKPAVSDVLKCCDSRSHQVSFLEALLERLQFGVETAMLTAANFTKVLKAKMW